MYTQSKVHRENRLELQAKTNQTGFRCIPKHLLLFDIELIDRKTTLIMFVREDYRGRKSELATDRNKHYR